MIVGSLRLCLRLQGTRSLKDKRRIIRSLIDRARRDFQASVAEVGDEDLWGNAEIGVASVGNSGAHVERVLQKVQELFEQCAEAEVVEVDLRVFLQ